VNLDGNVQWYLDDRNPNERYASFDYCFNYFQSFRESGAIFALANSSNLQASCLRLGFYLASWGMLRGSAELLQKSARHLIPLIEVIAQTNIRLWDLDAHSYTESNIQQLCELANTIRQARPGMSDTLVTKIMLGVFGSVPAFDTNFKKGCRAAGISCTFGRKSLRQIGGFYHNNAAVIDSRRVMTVDFMSGNDTQRRYTRAKVIDMAFFAEGELRGRAASQVAADDG
jgi:hypothetical protein